MNKLTVKTTSQTHPGNEVLGTKNKTMYYVIIGEGNEKVVIRCGEENHEKLITLTKGTNEKENKSEKKMV